MNFLNKINPIPYIEEAINPTQPKPTQPPASSPSTTTANVNNYNTTNKTTNLVTNLTTNNNNYEFVNNTTNQTTNNLTTNNLTTNNTLNTTNQTFQNTTNTYDQRVSNYDQRVSNYDQRVSNYDQRVSNIDNRTFTTNNYIRDDNRMESAITNSQKTIIDNINSSASRLTVSLNEFSTKSDSNFNNVLSKLAAVNTERVSEIEARVRSESILRERINSNNTGYSLPTKMNNSNSSLNPLILLVPLLFVLK